MMNMTMKKPTTWKTPPMEAPLRPFFGDGMEVTWNDDHDHDFFFFNDIFTAIKLFQSAIIRWIKICISLLLGF